MASHRDQAQFERAGWLLKLLIPFWIAQITMLLALIGTFSYRLSQTIRHWEEKDKAGSLPMVELVWECTNVGLSLLTLVLNTVEIAKTVSEALTPFSMVCTHVLKLTCAFATLGLDIFVYIRRSDQNYSIIGLAIDCGLLAATLVTFTYSVITFRRLRRYDDYHLTANVKPYGFRDGGDDTEMGNHVRISATNKRRSVSVTSAYPSVPYASQTGAGLSRSTTITTTTTSGGHGSSEPYSHQRDTLYDGYLHSRRHSSMMMPLGSSNSGGAGLAAVGADFGWGSGAPPAPAGRMVVRSASFVGAGVVHASTPDAGGEVARRDSEHGLVAVPEDGDDDDDDDDETVRGGDDVDGVDGGAQMGRRRAASEEDTRALLGPRGGEDVVPRGDMNHPETTGRGST